MQILLVRHGKKDTGGPTLDADRELSDEGKADARDLARKLKRVGLIPDFYFTSASRHAVITAQELMAELGADAVSPVELDTLTPGQNDPRPADVVDALLDEALEKGAEYRGDTVLAVVGHEPRLSQALARMTSCRVHPLGDAEAVCVAGDDLSTFLKGRGSIQFRTTMSGAPEPQLRSKVASKTTVAALLAGFTATGLIEVVTAEGLTGWETAAAGCLSAALSLFVACIFVYDQLSMPEGFWVYGRSRVSPRTKRTAGGASRPCSEASKRADAGFEMRPTRPHASGRRRSSSTMRLSTVGRSTPTWCGHGRFSSCPA